MLTLTCVAVNGDRYELNAGDTEEEAVACARAARVAAFLSRFGAPESWAGGQVTVTDRDADRLVMVARIVVRRNRG